MTYARLIADEHGRLHGLAALDRVAQLAGTAPDAESLLRTVGEAINDAFAADGYAIYLLDGSRLRAIAHRGATDAEMALFAQVPLEQTLVGRVASDGVGRSWRDDEFGDVARGIIAQTRYRAAVAVPLKVRARVIGCLNLGFFHQRTLEGGRLELLTVMAAHLAAAIEAQRLLQAQRATDAENAQLYAELRASAADLATLQSELGEKARLAALGELSAVVAHELRNPLGVLNNVLALLGRDATPEKQRSLLALGREEIARMDALVAELLEFARPGQPLRSSAPLAPLLEDAARAVGQQAEAAGVALRLAVEEGLPALRIDARRLRQAVLNLLVNAVQASPSGSAVELQAGRAGEAVRIAVSDRGPGIPPQLRGRLFQPFFTTKPTGTGLGLAVVQRVVTQHGGRIDLRTAPGAGTTFVIELPLSEAL